MLQESNMQKTIGQRNISYNISRVILIGTYSGKKLRQGPKNNNITEFPNNPTVIIHQYTSNLSDNQPQNGHDMAYVPEVSKKISPTAVVVKLN